MKLGILQLTGDLIPEVLLILLAIIVLGICLYSFIKHRDLPGAGYIVPLIYVIGMFSYFAIRNPAFEIREFYEKVGYIILLSDIAIWRIVGVIINRSRNGTGEKPITWRETKLVFRKLMDKIFKRGS